MRKLTLITIASAILSMATTVSAATVSLTQSLTTRGADMVFEFTDLGRTVSGSGTLEIVGTDADYATADNEYFDLVIEGYDQGRWACNGSTAPNAMLIATSSSPITPARCNFSMELALPASLMPAFLADGVFSFALFNGAGVDAISGNSVTATLTYSPIPLPASGVLLIAGLSGFAALRRRGRRRAS